MRLRPYAKFLGRMGRAARARPERPYRIMLAVTYWCNYRCQTCNIWKRRPKDELSLQEIRRVLRRAPYLSWVDITGGEIFLRRDAVEIFRAVLDSCPDVLLLHFQTNGYLTDQIVAAVETIARLRPPQFIITVSLDGDEALNDRIRGVTGGWTRQMETFRRLRAIRGVRAVLGMTLSTANADALEPTVTAVRRLVPDLTARDFHVNIAHTSGHFYGNEDLALQPDGRTRAALIRTIEAYRRWRGRPLDPVAFLEQEYLARVPSFLETGQTPMRCHALRSSCFIDPWGMVYPCSIYDAPVGSLREHDYDLSAVWQLPRARQLQREIWNRQCPQCWTPCEAYQTILGHLPMLLRSRAAAAVNPGRRLVRGSVADGGRTAEAGGTG